MDFNRIHICFKNHHQTFPVKIVRFKSSKKVRQKNQCTLLLTADKFFANTVNHVKLLQKGKKAKQFYIIIIFIFDTFNKFEIRIFLVETGVLDAVFFCRVTQNQIHSNQMTVRDSGMYYFKPNEIDACYSVFIYMCVYTHTYIHIYMHKFQIKLEEKYLQIR